ncbi:LacI family DNA-binding transcriptional regulator [Pseudactinotalea sp. HY158]|uniref:LacI family DNA-binding transcriptional regulator n=1 Tax=unclassified Pseudactinotalea TaxID=2649176 RepID=UPI0018834C2D|nr:LacI family DNA-binding transcriptional regulator [Pseudactinotalea sp. HY158]
MAKAPVMADVAARAGVSHQTVSRVLNSPTLVRPETRRRVLEAIEEMGYRRNLSARALATNRTRLIGVVNPSVTHFGPSHMAMAIQDAARASGYATISAGTDSETSSLSPTLDFFLDLAVDGLIVVAPTTEMAEATRDLADTLPVVIIAPGLTSPAPMHVVAVDHDFGARLATGHLASLGHEHIAHVSGPLNWFDARARLEGWRAELTDAGLSTAHLLHAGWGADDGYDAGLELLRRHREITAVFAANDLLALGLMRRFNEVGLRVPEDVSVVGYDDISGADYYQPPLTTVRQPFDAVGHKAIDVLLAAIDGSMSTQSLIHPRLVVRGSTGRRL